MRKSKADGVKNSDEEVTETLNNTMSTKGDGDLQLLEESEVHVSEDSVPQANGNATMPRKEPLIPVAALADVDGNYATRAELQRPRSRRSVK